jgi:hypothetical protein
MHNVPLLSVKPQGGGVGTSVISMVQGWYCLMSYHIDTVLDTNADTHVDPYTRLVLVVVLTILQGCNDFHLAKWSYAKAQKY